MPEEVPSHRHCYSVHEMHRVSVGCTVAVHVLACSHLGKEASHKIILPCMLPPTVVYYLYILLLDCYHTLVSDYVFLSCLCAASLYGSLQVWHANAKQHATTSVA